MSKQSKAIPFILIAVLTWPVGANTGYQGVLLNPFKSIQPQELIDDRGRQVLFPVAEGRYQLVFFGYTSCPDVCPMTMHKVRQVISNLKNRDGIQFNFVSIDGDRDKPQQIREFVEYFHPSIRGLTGDVYNIHQIEKAFGILVRRFQGKTALAYKLEHSVFMYLLNPEGKLMMMYPGTTTITQLSSDLNSLLGGLQ